MKRAWVLGMFLLLVITLKAFAAETKLDETQQDNVTSAYITDDTIVNADVNSAAAIATSKLSGAVTSIASHGLGTIATQAANNVSITGGAITGITDLAVADGGTGTSTGSITGTTALTFAAGGSAQNVTLTPSTTGYTILNGNVGIGTTSPGTKLDVSGAHVAGIGVARFTSSDDALLVLDAGGTTESGLRLKRGTTDKWFITNRGASSDKLVFSTDGANSLVVIQTDGNVGIGTTGPSTPLHVRATGYADVVNIFGGGRQSGNNGALVFGNVDGAAPWRIGRDNYTTGNFVIASADSSPALSIKTDGNVGIGTTSPGALLDIQSNSAEKFYLYHFGVTGDAIISRYRKAQGTQASPTVVANDEQVASLIFQGYDGANYQTAAQISARIDGTPGTSDMPGRLEFYTTPDGSSSPSVRMVIKNDGNVGIGTTGPTIKLSVNEPDSPSTRKDIAYFTSSLGNRDVFIEGRADIHAQASGIRFNSSGKFLISDSDTNVATFQSDGNVGIGTTGPTNRLSIGDDITSIGGGARTIAIGNTSGRSYYALGQSGTDFSAIAWMYNATPANAYLQIYNANGQAIVLNPTSGNVGIGTASPVGLLQAGTSPSPGLLVTAAGNLGIGTTNPLSRLHIKGSSDNFDGALQIERYNDTTKGNLLVNSAGLIVAMGGSGGVYIASGATSWTANSDIRLKTNITTIPNALERLGRIRGVNFNWIDPKSNQGTQIGVIAQEVEPVFPEIVDTKGEYWGVQYDKLGPILIEAIKEQQKQIQAQEERIRVLEARISKLKGNL